MTSPPWLTVVGIGDDGLAGLSPAARALVSTAELLVGGERHQAMVAETSAERLTWAAGLDTAMDVIARWRGRRVVVLATGDPMWFGGGANLSRRFSPAEMRVLPAPGAFSLAAAAMGWPLGEVEMLTVHGRPLATLNLFIRPGVRMLVLSRDGDTPSEVAALLTARGFGPSAISVLEHLGRTARTTLRRRGRELEPAAPRRSQHPRHRLPARDRRRASCPPVRACPMTRSTTTAN